MSVRTFELTIWTPNIGKDPTLVRKLKSAASLSWTGLNGDAGGIFHTFPNVPEKSLEILAEIANWEGTFVKVGQRLAKNRAKLSLGLQCYLDSHKKMIRASIVPALLPTIGFMVGTPITNASQAVAFSRTTRCSVTLLDQRYQRTN